MGDPLQWYRGLLEWREQTNAKLEDLRKAYQREAEIAELNDLWKRS